jgi:dephospho-CoA kinase
VTFILGLTGSIGMGKSTTAGFFRDCGVPVHDADQSVHALYRGEAVPAIAAAFPEAVHEGAVDRAILSRLLIDNPAGVKQLEAIVHPLVRALEARFLASMRLAGRPLVVLDIPLLFETGGERRCHAVAVVSAPEAIQRERVLARPGMTAERLAFLLSRQMPDAEKRRHAHFIIDTGCGHAAAKAQVRAIITCLAGRFGS